MFSTCFYFKHRLRSVPYYMKNENQRQTFTIILCKNSLFLNTHLKKNYIYKFIILAILDY